VTKITSSGGPSRRHQQIFAQQIFVGIYLMIKYLLSINKYLINKQPSNK